MFGREVHDDVVQSVTGSWEENIRVFGNSNWRRRHTDRVVWDRLSGSLSQAYRRRRAEHRNVFGLQSSNTPEPVIVKVRHIGLFYRVLQSVARPVQKSAGLFGRPSNIKEDRVISLLQQH